MAERVRDVGGCRRRNDGPEADAEPPEPDGFQKFAPRIL
jgi:hypothetical protein